MNKKLTCIVGILICLMFVIGCTPGEQAGEAYKKFGDKKITSASKAKDLKMKSSVCKPTTLKTECEGNLLLTTHRTQNCRVKVNEFPCPDTCEDNKCVTAKCEDDKTTTGDRPKCPDDECDPERNTWCEDEGLVGVHTVDEECDEEIFFEECEEGQVCSDGECTGVDDYVPPEEEGCDCGYCDGWTEPFDCAEECPCECDGCTCPEAGCECVDGENHSCECDGCVCPTYPELECDGMVCPECPMTDDLPPPACPACPESPQPTDHGDALPPVEFGPGIVQPIPRDFDCCCQMDAGASEYSVTPMATCGHMCVETRFCKEKPTNVLVAAPRNAECCCQMDAGASEYDTRTIQECGMLCVEQRFCEPAINLVDMVPIDYECCCQMDFGSSEYEWVSGRDCGYSCVEERFCPLAGDRTTILTAVKPDVDCCCQMDLGSSEYAWNVVSECGALCVGHEFCS